MSAIEAAMLVYEACIGEHRGAAFQDEKECRSPAGADFVEVLSGGQWYRLTAVPVDEPVSIEEHRA